MIKFSEVTKHYGKGHTLVKALNGVSFTLPDKGFVFIVGKSDSGKSTLMSLIGGLDDATSGSIEIDGVDITKLKNNELDVYRNNYVGTIYQSFNLFDDESVMENIRSSLDISGKRVSDEEVDEILKSLDLFEKKHALARELSGGQKQRVAIARALSKNPELILADEPTGNLDSKTTKSILNILRDISKTKLVVIISHDIPSAIEYADRMITLSDGHVIADQERNPNFIENKKHIFVSADVDEEIIKEANESLKEKDISLTKHNDRFIDFNREVVSTNPRADFGKVHHSFKTPLKLSLGFLKTMVVTLVVIFLVSTGIVALLSMSRDFTNFDGQEAINDLSTRYNNKTLVIQRGYSITNNLKDISKTYLIEPKAGELEKITENYKGNTYPIYNINIWNVDYSLDYQESREVDRYASLFCKGNEGLAVVDEKFLSKTFGDYKVVAGSLEACKDSTDIIITDYVADCMLYYNKANGSNSIRSTDTNDPYKILLKERYQSRYKIGAVISTNYKERYDSLIKMYERVAKETQNASYLMQQLTSSDLFVDFTNEMASYGNFAYSLNPNFYEEYLDDFSNFEYSFSFFCNAFLYDRNNKEITHYDNKAYVYSMGTEEDKNKFFISANIYNIWFNKQITSGSSSDFEEQEIRVDSFTFDQTTKENPKKSFTVKITSDCIRSECENSLFVSFDVLKTLKRESVHLIGYMFDDANGFYDIYDKSTPNYYYTTSMIFTPVFQVIDIVNIFSKIFNLVSIILIILIFIIIIYYNTRLMRRNQYKIGVFKSLGYSTWSITWGAVLNCIYLFITIFLGSFLATFLLSGRVNVLLGQAFSNFLGSNIFTQLSLISFNFASLAVYVGIIFGISVISLIIPIIRIRNTKPNAIINKAE